MDGPTRELDVEPGRSAILDNLDPCSLRPIGPAAIIGKYGQGKAVFIAGSLSSAYYGMENYDIRELMSGVLDWLDVRRQAEVSGITKGFENEFEVGVLEGIDDENRRAVVCLNHSSVSVHPTLILSTGPESIVRELFTNTDALFEVSGDELRIMTHIPEREVRVYYEAKPE
jgi:hypothetical protein